jgi:hypothetical protein
MKIFLATVLSLILLSSGGAALAYEEPQYDIVKKYEGFELRRYAPYLVAETQVSGAFEDVGNRAFRVLADFIFGNNRKREKMAMTTPVKQRPLGSDSEQIGMTAPVISRSSSLESGDDDSYVFSFVMPSKYSIETVPKPVDPRVQIKQVPAKLIAARRYSGTWSYTKYRENESVLLRGFAKTGIKQVGAPVFARYNSPFTLWFLRRNEVLIEVAPIPGK